MTGKESFCKWWEDWMQGATPPAENVSQPDGTRKGAPLGAAEAPTEKDPGLWAKAELISRLFGEGGSMNW